MILRDQDGKSVQVIIIIIRTNLRCIIKTKYCNFNLNIIIELKSQ